MMLSAGGDLEYAEVDSQKIRRVVKKKIQHQADTDCYIIPYEAAVDDALILLEEMHNVYENPYDIYLSLEDELTIETSNEVDGSSRSISATFYKDMNEKEKVYCCVDLDGSCDIVWYDSLQEALSSDFIKTKLLALKELVEKEKV